MPKLVDVEERRAELADAAARVIARSGLAGASLREVAAEAGWTTGALTHYFTDKRELLRFTLEASLERRRARRPRHPEIDPEAALRAALIDALPVAGDARLHWIVTMAFCAQAEGDADLATLQRDAYREFRANVAQLVRWCGRSHGAAAVTEAERLIAVLDGVAVQALFDPQSWPAERQRGAIDAALAATRPAPDSR
jgi:AcrR family transcriptional regulator